MGIACLEMPQAGPPAVLATLGAVQFPVKVRKGTPGGIDSRPSRQFRSDPIAASRDLGREWAVVQQAIAGDADAQEQLFAPHTRRLYRVVFALLHNREDAEDVLQDGLCKAFTSLRSFQGRSSFSTWLTRIVINSALMARRRKSAHPEASLDEILDSRPEKLSHEVVDARPDPEELYAAIEINALVEEHLHQFPVTLQTAFRLHAINGLSGPESCKAIGISPSAFKSRIFRARWKLASGLKQLARPRLSSATADRRPRRERHCGPLDLQPVLKQRLIGAVKVETDRQHSMELRITRDSARAWGGGL